MGSRALHPQRASAQLAQAPGTTLHSCLFWVGIIPSGCGLLALLVNQGWQLCIPRRRKVLSPYSITTVTCWCVPSHHACGMNKAGTCLGLRGTSPGIMQDRGTALPSVKQDSPYEKNCPLHPSVKHNRSQGEGPLPTVKKDVPYVYIRRVTKYTKMALYGKGVDSGLFRLGSESPGHTIPDGPTRLSTLSEP